MRANAHEQKALKMCIKIRNVFVFLKLVAKQPLEKRYAKATGTKNIDSQATTIERQIKARVGSRRGKTIGITLAHKKRSLSIPYHASQWR